MFNPVSTLKSSHHIQSYVIIFNYLLSAGDGAESRAIVTPPPTSCADLAQLGNRIAGFHLVLDKESNNRIQTVYCDFALAFNNPGTSPYSFQARIILNSILITY